MDVNTGRRTAARSGRLAGAVWLSGVLLGGNEIEGVISRRWSTADALMIRYLMLELD